MSSEIDSLVEMGFPRHRAEKALAVSGNRGIEAAMEWLFAHAEDPDIDEPYKPPVGHVLGKEESATPGAEGSEKVPVENSEQPSDAASPSGEPKQALSRVCDDCGKRLRSENDVQLHAARSGHSNFSESTEEIKPLTEEEKKQQLEKIQQRLKERKEQKLAEEKKNALEKEKSRRKMGKEMTSIKQKMEFQEAQKIANERKKEKMEERLARQRVRDQIARDRAEQAEKFQFGKGGTDLQSGSGPAVVAPAQPVQPAAAVEKKQHTTCKLQFRLTNGSTITGTFQATDTLGTVRGYVHENRTDGSAPFNLMTTFPRKTYTDQDLGTSLEEAGLVPSAVLILTKL